MTSRSCPGAVLFASNAATFWASSSTMARSSPNSARISLICSRLRAIISSCAARTESSWPASGFRRTRATPRAGFVVVPLAGAPYRACILRRRGRPASDAGLICLILADRLPLAAVPRLFDVFFVPAAMDCLSRYRCRREASTIRRVAASDRRVIPRPTFPQTEPNTAFPGKQRLQRIQSRSRWPRCCTERSSTFTASVQT